MAKKRPSSSAVKHTPGTLREPQQNRVVMTQVTHRSGPLPDPQTLAEYDRVVPGAAERILVMAERQQAHRQNLEAADLQAAVLFAKRGQWMALCITVLAFVVGSSLAFVGQTTVASILFGTVIVAVVGAFLGSKSIAKKAKQGH